MPRGKGTVVPNHVDAGRRDEGAQSSEEGVRRHLGEGGPGLSGGFEMNADLAVGPTLDGIVGEGGAEEIAANTFEAFTVAAVDGDGGMGRSGQAKSDQPRPQRPACRRRCGSSNVAARALMDPAPRRPATTSPPTQPISLRSKFRDRGAQGRNRTTDTRIFKAEGKVRRSCCYGRLRRRPRVRVVAVVNRNQRPARQVRRVDFGDRIQLDRHFL